MNTSKNIPPLDSFLSELEFKSSRSSGSGGQHVNKTESRVTLFFDVNSSDLLTEEQKQRVLLKSAAALSKKGVWQISVEQSRSQHKNKKIALDLFYQWLVAALKLPRKRIPSKPGKEAVKKRLKRKKIQSLKKQNRRKDFL
jgi:ribosome-associated protein